MRRIHAAALLLVAVSAPCLAAPPTLELPETVKGEPGSFIQVPAKTDGKHVSWRAVDPGLNLFPVELLRDTKTAVVTARDPGRYRLWAVTAGGDEPGPFIETVIVVGVPGEPIPPPETDPVPAPPSTSLYFLIIRKDGPADASFTRIMSDPAWDDLRAGGHTYKDKTVSEARKLNVSLAPGTFLPAVVTLRVSADGKSSKIVREAIPLPTASDNIRKLPEGVQ